MKQITQEWLDKGEGDFTTALRELRARKSPNYDACCFHAQQCVEKYLKADLQERDIPFERVHHLTLLLDKLLPVNPMLELLRSDLQSLNQFAVEFRYPGECADKELAGQAVRICKRIRIILRAELGLETGLNP